jgi:hypothetical protein
VNEPEPDYFVEQIVYQEISPEDDVQISFIEAEEITFAEFEEDEYDEDEYYDDEYYEEVKPLPPPSKQPSKTILKKNPVPNKTRRVRWLDLI